MRFAALQILLVLAGLTRPIAVEAAVPSSPIGVWANPKRTVNVRAEACRDRLCGTIVHATPAALEAARAKGVTSLVGTRVFQDMEYRSSGLWRGKLYVPDLGGRFASTLRLLDDNRLEVKGCILGGLICKSQIWTRVAAPD